MEKSVNNLILDKADEIVKEIKNSKDYQDYQFLFQKLLSHEKANTLIKEVKKLQKEMVKKESIGESILDLEKEMNSLLEELNLIPLYVEFVVKQEELNRICQDIKVRLETYFDDLLS